MPAGIVFGEHMEPLTLKLTLGFGSTLIGRRLDSTGDPVSWSGPTVLEFAAAGVSDITATLNGSDATFVIPEATVAAIYAADDHAVRLTDAGAPIAGGRVSWLPRSGWDGEPRRVQTAAFVIAGPPGPTAVSADAGNALGLGTDGLLYLDESELGGTGGDTTAQVGTFDLPESPTEGQTVSILADEGTVIPEGITWDSGGEPTVTGRLLIACVWSGVDWVCTYGLPIAAAPEPPDETAPTVPADLTATADGYTAIDLTWSASTDAVGVTGYEYRVDGGTPVDVGDVLAATASGLTAATSYDFEVRAYDAAGNFSAWSAVVSESTDAIPVDETPPTPGTLAASAITSDSFTLTVTGASDDEALHAQPYRFSTDDGATYSAYQTAATFDATGLDPETEYTCVHQVRDAALNVATGSSILVETDAESGATVLVFDDFNRANGALGTSTSGDTWVGIAGVEVLSNAGFCQDSSNRIAFIDSGATDIAVTADTGTIVDAFGLVVRGDGTSANYYRVVVTLGKWYVVRVVGGSASIINTITDSPPTSSMGVTVTTSGSSVDFQMYRDGSLLYSYSDTSGSRLTAGTFAGVYGQEAVFDNFTVEG